VPKEHFWKKRNPSTNMIYRLRRHVIYVQEHEEVWGIDRAAPGLSVITGPRCMDKDDPLGTSCALLLLLNGHYVTWPDIFEWLGMAEGLGYTVISGYEKLSPYSTILIRGP